MKQRSAFEFEGQKGLDLRCMEEKSIRGEKSGFEVDQTGMVADYRGLSPVAKEKGF